MRPPATGRAAAGARSGASCPAVNTSAAPSSPAAPATPVQWADPARGAACRDWLASLDPALGLDAASLRSASADASFRRYLRLDGADGRSHILMDAPPAQEDCRPFVQVAGLLQAAGVRVPRVQAWQQELGFMLLDDLGSTTYLAELGGLNLAQPADLKRADGLWRDALAGLVRLQAGSLAAQGQVPAYDRALMAREIQLFPDWYIARHHGRTLSDRQQQGLDRAVEAILQTCLAQPCVLVHRDFHSRNLMVQPDQPGGQPGVLDFQDAVWGPISYDLVSLLRDAYVDWDEAVQIDWAARYWSQARKAGLPVPDDFGSFWRDVEWMGLQRHLKVLGIFCRLWHRDGKDGYLADLPRVWRQAHHVAMRYSVLTPLARLLEEVGGVQAEAGFTF
ncbi:MAG: hypothetical protein RL722_28 [Pseudomonadota bacterium]|jgi:aminoglycoside/choline kinase family phosphotransferase